MKIGLFIGALPTKMNLHDQIKMIINAEKRGFDSFWFAQTGETDVLTTIALAGQETENIELATGVIPIYTRHPNVLAQQATTVNAAISNRLVLGIGPSHRPGTERLGLKYDRPAQYVREYVEILRELTTQGQTNYQGKVFNIESSFNLIGSTPMPIMISALAPMMLKVAGEVADGTITWMAGLTALRRHVIPKLNAASANAQREQLRVVAGVPFSVTDDVKNAKIVAGEKFQIYGRLENYRRILDYGEVEGPSDVAILGNEVQLAEQIAQYFEAGVTDLILAPFATDIQDESNLSNLDILQGIATEYNA